MARDAADDRLKRRLASLAAAASSAPIAAEKPKAAKKTERASARTLTYRMGRVIYSGKNELNCVIKDIGASGARIILDGEAALPPEVTLVISQTAARKKAKVVWQKEREVGLSFA